MTSSSLPAGCNSPDPGSAGDRDFAVERTVQPGNRYLELLLRLKMNCNVSAVVHICAAQFCNRCHGGQDFVRHGPRDRGHGRYK